ncbi:hypothetical protein ACRAWF_09635 [Streptomyces sp. L7]
MLPPLTWWDRGVGWRAQAAEAGDRPPHRMPALSTLAPTAERGPFKGLIACHGTRRRGVRPT